MTISAVEEKMKVVAGIPAGSYAAATVNGAVFDTKDFDELLIILDSKLNQATGTLDVKVQEGRESDLSDAADITGAVFAQITTVNDATIYHARINCKNWERYMRIVGVVAVADCEYGVTVILCKHDGLSPVTQVNATSFKV